MSYISRLLDRARPPAPLEATSVKDQLNKRGRFSDPEMEDAFLGELEATQRYTSTVLFSFGCFVGMYGLSSIWGTTVYEAGGYPDHPTAALDQARAMVAGFMSLLTLGCIAVVWCNTAPFCLSLIHI